MFSPDLFSAKTGSRSGPWVLRSEFFAVPTLMQQEHSSNIACDGE